MKCVDNLSVMKQKSILRQLRELYYGYSQIINDTNLLLLILAGLWEKKGNLTLLEKLENAAKNNIGRIHLTDKLFGNHDFQVPEQTIEGIKLVRDTGLLDIEPKVALSILDEELGCFIKYNNEPKLPRWLCDFMILLANINEDSCVFNPYNNNGEILTAALLKNEKVKTIGFCKNVGCAIYSVIEHIIFNKYNKNILINDKIENLQNPTFGPTHIISTPFFGKKKILKTPEWLFYKTDRVDEIILQYSLASLKSGRLVVLVPDGLLFDGGSRIALRRHINEFKYIRAIIALDKGTLLSHPNVKANIMVIDTNKKTNSDQVFMSKLNLELADDTFDSSDIPSAKEVSDDFIQWDINHEFNSNGKSWLVSKNDLDINNLTVNRYFTEEKVYINKENIPHDLKILKNITAFIKNGKKLKISNKGKYDILTSAAIRKMKIIHSHIVKSDYTGSGTPIITQRGNILINALGTQIGEAVMVTENDQGLHVGNNVICVKPLEEIVLPEYLEIALNSQFVKRQLLSRAGGTVITTISANRIEDICIPIPDIKEQRKIIDGFRLIDDKLHDVKKQFEQIKNEYDHIIDTLTITEPLPSVHLHEK